jgi:hypothetical protein
VNRDSLTSSLPIFVLFISSSCHIALAMYSKAMLNRSRGCGHSYLIPVIRENGFCFSSLSTMLTIGLSYIAFIILRYIPLIRSFMRAFVMK